MFRVRWKKSALDEMATHWTASDSTHRQAITKEVHAIDGRLQLDPNGQGESRPNGRRILFEPPVGVLFRIRPDLNVVQVLQFWCY
jgi:hypothetical protein